MLKSFYKAEDSAQKGVAQAWQNGDWQPELVDEALDAATRNTTLESISLALKVHHATVGFATGVPEVFNELLTTLPAKATWSKVALRLCGAYLQSQELSLAHQQVQQNLPGACSVRCMHRLIRFPNVLDFLHEHYPEKLWGPVRKQADLARQLNCQVGSFDVHSLGNSFDNRADDQSDLRVAVVGNGTSLLDAPSGQLIDDHDIVIRFNQPVLKEKYQAFTGSKTDALVISPTLAKDLPVSGVDQVVISGINIFSGESGYWQHVSRATAQTKIAVFDQSCWYSLVSELRAPPSSGLLTLASLARKQSVDVSSFGFTKAQATHSEGASDGGTAYAFGANGSHYGDQNIASARHNWQREAELVSQLT